MAATHFCKIFSCSAFLVRQNAISFCSGRRQYSVKKTLGFVGVGNMGRPMVKNLLKKNHPVLAYDVVPAALETIKKDGAQTAASPAEVASNADIVFTMLPTNQHVYDCYLGPNGILEGAKKGSIFVDSSTVDPSVPQTLEKKAAEKGAILVDAPVSGGTPGAEAGTLTFMVGGDKNTCDIIKPFLECMGINVFHCGPVGCGQGIKICNNMLLAISLLGVSEALHLGKSFGIEPKLLSDILNVSTGRCWASEKYNPAPGVVPGIPSSNNYEGGFMNKLMAKDLGLAQDSATRLKTPIPLGAITHQFYRMMVDAGHGEKDMAYIYQFLRQMK